MRVVLIHEAGAQARRIESLIRETWADAQIAAASTLAEGKSVASIGPPPDLILLDTQAPDGSTLSAIKHFVAVCPTAPVVIVAHGLDDVYAAACVDIGARGCLPMTMSDRSVRAALCVIVSGETFVPWRLRSRQSRSMCTRPDARPAKHLSLTRRERQVLQELSHGKSNKDIAASLDIAEVTVKLHVRGVLRKLRARNRAQAVRRAIEHQLLQ